MLVKLSHYFFCGALCVYLFVWSFLLSPNTFWNSYISNISADFFENPSAASSSSTLKPEKPPLILAYTEFFQQPIFNNEVLQELKQCEYECVYSNEKWLYPEAAVAIFHVRDFKSDPILFSTKNYERLNVFYTLESAANEQIRSYGIPKDFFNVSLTFRLDSTLWRPYDHFEALEGDDDKNVTFSWNDKQVEKHIEKKQDLLLQFVSWCWTHSGREKYLEELQSITNVTVFGRCNNRPWPGKEWEATMKIEFDKHFFYLAFENSVCENYVTEKAWRLKHLIVPVVLKRSTLNGIIDDDLFIAADDFPSPEALVEALKNYTQNLDEYKKFFRWTKKYKKIKNSEAKLNDFCRLCKMATAKERHAIKDIYQWWEGDSKCEEGFAQKLIH